MLRLFAWVRVTSATGKSRRRRVGVRKAKTLDELTTRFKFNVARFVTDPTIKSVTVDVRLPPRPDEYLSADDLADMADAGEDDFTWRHDETLSNRFADLLQGSFPSVKAGHVAS